MLVIMLLLWLEIEMMPLPSRFSWNIPKLYIPIKDWKNITKHLEAVTAVVSCIGVATEGSKAVVDAMNLHDISHVMAMNFMGLGDYKACMEHSWAEKITDGLFATCSQSSRA
jgi:hypothetical protein